MCDGAVELIVMVFMVLLVLIAHCLEPWLGGQVQLSGLS